MNIQTDYTLQKLESILSQEARLHEQLSILLKDQQAAILERQPRRLLEVNALISARSAEAVIVKTQREIATKAFAEAHGFSLKEKLRDILVYLTEPIFDSLKKWVEIINFSMRQSSRLSNQNSILSERILRTTQGLLKAIAPGVLSSAYNNKGSFSSNLNWENTDVEFLA